MVVSAALSAKSVEVASRLTGALRPGTPLCWVPCWCGSTARSEAARPRLRASCGAGLTAASSAIPSGSVSGLHGMLPPQLRTNFQHFAAWRHGVHEVLDLVAREWDGPVTVPMTLINPGYFDDVVGRLRADGHDVRHFSLLASRATVLRRLRGRTFGLGRRHEQWAVARLDECLAQPQDPLFAEHVQTDDLSAPPPPRARGADRPARRSR
jgi:hypothetical protein